MSRIRLVAGIALFVVLLPASPRAESDAFLAQATAAYRREVERYAARGQLDTDAALLDRSRQAVKRLAAAAAMDRPETAAWPWEVHVAADPAIAAYCIAGGRLMVGGPYVHRLSLEEPELAMLIAHEMAHALAHHRRARPEAASASMDGDPAGELRANAEAIAQEDEADAIGIALALRAGWDVSGIVGFFDKVAMDEPAGTFSTSHARSGERAQRARERTMSARGGAGR